MKKVVVLCCVAGAFVACSGASLQDPLNEPPVTNTHYNAPDASITDVSIVNGNVADANTDVTVCVPENDATFCNRYMTSCGAVIGLDNCNTTRTVALCGACKSTEFCNAGFCSSLPCLPETDAALCSSLDKNCGSLPSTPDNCGVLRTPVCGPSCGVDAICATNKCCVPDSDITLCNASSIHWCGPLNVVDNCGTPRMIPECGAIVATKKCDSPCVNNVCCGAVNCAAAECGFVNDLCGVSRPCGNPVNAGICPAPKVCIAGVCK